MANTDHGLTYILVLRAIVIKRGSHKLNTLHRLLLASHVDLNAATVDGASMDFTGTPRGVSKLVLTSRNTDFRGLIVQLWEPNPYVAPKWFAT